MIKCRKAQDFHEEKAEGWDLDRVNSPLAGCRSQTSK